ncbi:APO RNA-binding protein (DUF794) [Tasmannia lanceolata]|uniref:APO RNA-binding protein (DUF794) n=1 Tax=Tasmannia lanceolata TaxID=3420 RepID=UPI004062D3C4
MQRRVVWEITRHNKRLLQFRYFASDKEEYADVPKPSKRWERKPYPTPMKVLIRRAKEEKEARKANPCKILQPPDNGLLVSQLVELAHRVNRARESLLHGLSELVDEVVPVKRCRFCSEVHIGNVGHEIRTCTGPKSGFRSATHVWRRGGVEDVVHFPLSYHLHDRVGKPRVSHDERFRVERLPAILELCIQAGLDIEEYPTKRRTKPVYWIDGRIVDFEAEREETTIETSPSLPVHSYGSIVDFEVEREEITIETGPSPLGHSNGKIISCQFEGGKSLSVKTLESWFEMRLGAEMIMEKYSVKTCGYCPEVQVGPKGNKVRLCRAAKHQFRNGLHAWQEATIDDLVGPNYVWHVRDPHGPALINELKRYYGKAPAVVELCVQAGAPVPDKYRSMMRLDVVSPDRDEIDLIA